MKMSKKTVTKTFSVGIIMMFLAGCQAIKSPFDEGYQFGDMTKSTLAVQAKYCAESDPVQRALMLTAIKSVLPEFPSSGACTDLYKLVPEDTVNDIAKDVDFEQAIEDQKRYQGK